MLVPSWVFGIDDVGANRGAVFVNKMTKSPRGQSMRARFSIMGRSNDENDRTAWVMLNLPEDAVRTYSLRYDAGRLHAEEFKRGRSPD